MKTVAELVDDLFKTYRKANGKEYSYTDVSLALNGSIDPSHISKLRSGQIKNPSRETLLALCQFFKVPSSYFFPELEERSQAEVTEDVLDLVTRARVDENVKQKLKELIKALEDRDQAEGERK